MTPEIDRTALMALAAKPIGDRALQEELGVQALIHDPEAIEAAKRASKTWLPGGKRSASSREEREYRQAFREQQVDLEDAVEQAGGQRGQMLA